MTNSAFVSNLQLRKFPEALLVSFEGSPLPKDSKYLLDEEGNILHYSNGQPVCLDDFDNEPSDKSYEAAKKRPHKELVQLMLASGVPVTKEILRKAGYDVE